MKEKAFVVPFFFLLYYFCVTVNIEIDNISDLPMVGYSVCGFNTTNASDFYFIFIPQNFLYTCTTDMHSI